MVRDPAHEDTSSEKETTFEGLVPLKDILRCEEDLDKFDKVQLQRDYLENLEVCTESTPEKVQNEQTFSRAACPLQLSF